MLNRVCASRLWHRASSQHWSLRGWAEPNFNRTIRSDPCICGGWLRVDDLERAVEAALFAAEESAKGDSNALKKWVLDGGWPMILIALAIIGTGIGSVAMLVYCLIFLVVTFLGFVLADNREAGELLEIGIAIAVISVAVSVFGASHHRSGDH